jgi:hypothetical protein
MRRPRRVRACAAVNAGIVVDTGVINTGVISVAVIVGGVDITAIIAVHGLAQIRPGLLLDVLDHRQDGALRPHIAAGGEFDLAAQDSLDGRDRFGAAILHHDDRTVRLPQRQFLETPGRPAARPAARIAGLALPELRVPRRLAVADLVETGFRLGGGHDGAPRREEKGAARRTGSFEEKEQEQETIEFREVFQTRDILQQAVRQEAKYKYITSMKIVNKPFLQISHQQA